MNSIKLLSDYFFTVATRFGSKFINLVFFAVIARYLEVYEMGVYGYIFTTSLLLAIVFDLGLRNSLTKYVGENPSLKSPCILTLNSLFIFFSILQFPVVYYLSFYTGMEIIDMDVMIIFYCISISMTYLRTIQGLFIGLGEIKEFNYSEMMPRFVLMLGIIYILVKGSASLKSVLTILALSQLIGALWTLYLQRAVFGSKFQRLLLPSKVIKSILLNGFVFMISVLLMNAGKRMHIYVLSDSGDESGTYFALLRATEVMTEVALGIAIVALSRVASKSKGGTENIASIARVCRTSLLLLLPVLIFTLIFRNIIIDIFLGGRYLSYTSEFVVISVASYIGLFTTLVFPVLAIILRPVFMILALIPSVLLSVALYYWISFDYSITLNVVVYILLAASFSNVIGILAVVYWKFRYPWYRFFIPEKADFKFR